MLAPKSQHTEFEDDSCGNVEPVQSRGDRTVHTLCMHCLTILITFYRAVTSDTINPANLIHNPAGCCACFHASYLY